MTPRDAKRPKRVGEPVQVFLAPVDEERLRTLAHRLETSKSDVLRRGLAALEREVVSPDDNPVLGLIGIITDDAGVTGEGRDLARGHDAFLSEAIEAKVKRGARRKHRSS